MQFIYLHLHLWNVSSPPDHLLQTGPHLAHLCQVLHSVPTVSLQPPPALLQICPLIPLLLQQILQLGEHQADWCDFFIYPWPGPQWSADLLTSSACSFSLAFSLVRRFTFSSSHCKSSMACCKNKTETCGSVEQMWCKFPAKNGSHLTGMLSFGRSQRKHDGLIKSDPERDIHSSLKWSKLKCKAPTLCSLNEVLTYLEMVPDEGRKSQRWAATVGHLAYVTAHRSYSFMERKRDGERKIRHFLTF